MRFDNSSVNAYVLWHRILYTEAGLCAYILYVELCCEVLCGVVVCVHMYYRIEFYTQKQVYAYILYMELWSCVVWSCCVCAYVLSHRILYTEASLCTHTWSCVCWHWTHIKQLLFHCQLVQRSQTHSSILFFRKLCQLATLDYYRSIDTPLTQIQVLYIPPPKYTEWIVVVSVIPIMVFSSCSKQSFIDSSTLLILCVYVCVCVCACVHIEFFSITFKIQCCMIWLERLTSYICWNCSTCTACCSKATK